MGGVEITLGVEGGPGMPTCATGPEAKRRGRFVGAAATDGAEAWRFRPERGGGAGRAATCAKVEDTAQPHEANAANATVVNLHQPGARRVWPRRGIPQ